MNNITIINVLSDNSNVISLKLAFNVAKSLQNSIVYRILKYESIIKNAMAANHVITFSKINFFAYINSFVRSVCIYKIFKKVFVK